MAVARRVPGTWSRLLAHPSFRWGLLLFGLVVLCGLMASWVSPYDPLRNNFRARLVAPGEAHWLGTDRFGRDILSRTLHGAQVSLRIGLAVAGVTALVGGAVGALAGFARRLDGPLMRLMDALMAFPAVLLAIALAAALGPSEINAILALSIAYVPRTARVMRAGVMVVREFPFVEGAQAIGASSTRVLLRHVLPNALAPLVVQQTYVFALAVLAEAVLSFLGVGPPPPTPTLGGIISEGRDYIQEAPWISIVPGIGIALTVLGLNLMGDGLRDALDPRLRDAVR
ncbi:ABC transporter permease [Roseomonas marmotae]|uniref:ABC transporter permease n=1 Tax=Roseomonas marmotae TaxID=2768161 RepID=A0ABS3K8N6_9PROT|nr:ABC transporter permease [Roseomonas marmotae]MBO1073828.1 ABC transporter permease [Roseomonas marmotae]QTI78543.1 ABC transporter permease [Roseomonas marmotae]